ncbi:MAG: Ribosomal RNA large subunit methyltransferase N [uncultured bacterium (gcode 4)]|uniref:Ribosomal RNA large subunit methyltransferase N n=1 Tax=uncultured bacterium (gcode 4) TaxID=1234023 RepID=K2F9K1_9BACT|nr:MAG: Ribosomal RNA large subunit methyltransferase N [uncultured bacterium (gcode 4)]
MYSIHDEENLKRILIENWEKPFRYAQIENAIYKNFIKKYDDITTISKVSKTILNNNFFYSCLKLKKNITSEDWQTTKLLFETTDWNFLEAVIMRHLSWRNTLCVSSQVGCPMACAFCATWKLWFTRNLEFYEIVEQILFASKLLDSEWKNLRNIVYMWMWEPFLNYENVKKSIEIVCSQNKLDFSNRRVTISTCWIVPWIKKFWTDFPQTSLAISLHAATDELRKSIMPCNIMYPLSMLMPALEEYVAKTNKKVFYEYIMIAWVNDSLENAKDLAELLRWKLAHVNFIPYNEGEGDSESEMKSTSKSRIKEFQNILFDVWLQSTIRHTMGDDIDAACWQLATREWRESGDFSSIG